MSGFTTQRAGPEGDQKEVCPRITRGNRKYRNTLTTERRRSLPKHIQTWTTRSTFVSYLVPSTSTTHWTEQVKLAKYNTKGSLRDVRSLACYYTRRLISPDTCPIILMVEPALTLRVPSNSHTPGSTCVFRETTWNIVQMNSTDPTARVAASRWEIDSHQLPVETNDITSQYK